MGGNGHHGVLFGDHYDELTIRAVRAEGVVTAAPHLIAIALDPVAFGLCLFTGVGLLQDLGAGGFGDPFLGKELLAVPFALLKHELTQFGHVFGLDPQPPAAAVDAHGAFIPLDTGDAQRTEQARIEEIKRLLAGEDNVAPGQLAGHIDRQFGPVFLYAG